MNAFELFALLKLNKDSYEKGLHDAENQAHTAGSKIGAIFASVGKMAVAGIGAGATAVGKLAKDSITAFADYEQLVGGVETLFKDSALAVQAYADIAYKTAGISANNYMETVTSFSASLLKSLNDDTAETAKVANRAIIDMSDNVNKMGTSMESIQNAYNGFAKQNYTMLDNLKLGYSGTKEEMAQLIEDASKMTDIQKELNITVEDGNMSFGNIVNAISVVQKKLGITGTTAKEASATISGSLNMLKASWENLKVAFAKDDQYGLEANLKEFTDSIKTVVGNVVPAIERTFPAIADGLASLVQEAVKNLPKVVEKGLPMAIKVGMSIVKAVLQGAKEALPAIKELIAELVGKGLDFLNNDLSPYINAGFSMVQNVAQGIIRGYPTFVTTGWNMTIKFVEGILKNIPAVLKGGADLITNLLKGMVEAVPRVVEQIPTIITRIADAFSQFADKFSTNGGEIITNLITGIAGALFKLIEYAPTIIKTIGDGISQNLPKILEAGFKILITLGDGIIHAIPQLVEKLPEVIDSIFKALGEALQQAFNFGVEFIKSIGQGIWSMVDWLAGVIVEALDSAFNSMKRQLNSFVEDVSTKTGISVADIRTYAQTGALPSNVTNININQRIATADELARELRTSQRMGLRVGAGGDF